MACASRDKCLRANHVLPMATKRPCVVCGLEFMPIRNDGKTCSDTCRQRLPRVGHNVYIETLPQASPENWRGRVWLGTNSR
jgi:hypothetical protein